MHQLGKVPAVRKRQGSQGGWNFAASGALTDAASCAAGEVRKRWFDNTPWLSQITVEFTAQIWQPDAPLTNLSMSAPTENRCVRKNVYQQSRPLDGIISNHSSFDDDGWAQLSQGSITGIPRPARNYRHFSVCE
jgi:hypothetical protein